MIGARDRLILALDVPSRAGADALLESVGDAVRWVKVGLELFIAEGPDLVRDLVARDFRVMLDLKLHDIPATVERAAERAAALGVALLTIHASGQREMIEAAARGAARGGDGVRVLGVTVLTSVVDDGDSLADRVVALAREAVACGCGGVVASAQEAARLRAVLPPEAWIVTPGIRLVASDDDQRRTLGPAAARSAGVDAIVVGRPIRDAPSPRAAALAFVRALEDGDAG